MAKDWTGNGNSVFKSLGASSHSDKEREENDYYATSPVAAEWLLQLETLSSNIWEPACGEGHLSKVFKNAGYKVFSTDLIDRGYGQGGVDFLKLKKTWDGDIVTNPPYKYATKFVEKGLELVTDGNKVIMFLKVQFLEGKARKKLFKKYPPKIIHVSSSRILCAKNGMFPKVENGKKIIEQGIITSSAVAYSWFVWEKGYVGKTTVDWFN